MYNSRANPDLSDKNSGCCPADFINAHELRLYPQDKISSLCDIHKRLKKLLDSWIRDSNLVQKSSTEKRKGRYTKNGLRYLRLVD